MTSHAFEWASSELGSQLRFIRYFGQYFKYVPLGKEQRVPWSNRLKTRFVYAGGVRVGLARGLGGQDLVPSERFFAGGGTTIRGFQQDRVGPLLVGEPIGGNAVLIINNEVRHPLFWIVDGVGFVDAGNVYPKVSDFSFSDIRKSAGVGVRLRTPYFLLRLDYGVKLDRRPGERVGQLFFSIGQAF
jgi:outer membrane protein assembly factor BamA